jgi:hypothetical protein
MSDCKYLENILPHRHSVKQQSRSKLGDYFQISIAGTSVEIHPVQRYHGTY